MIKHIPMDKMILSKWLTSGFMENGTFDFIITGATRELLEDKIKPEIINFLSERDLSLYEEKTLITRIDQGFDFLGQNVRKYDGKLLIKPSRKKCADLHA